MNWLESERIKQVTPNSIDQKRLMVFRERKEKMKVEKLVGEREQVKSSKKVSKS